MAPVKDDLNAFKNFEWQFRYALSLVDSPLVKKTNALFNLYKYL